MDGFTHTHTHTLAGKSQGIRTHTPSPINEINCCLRLRAALAHKPSKIRAEFRLSTGFKIKSSPGQRAKRKRRLLRSFIASLH